MALVEWGASPAPKKAPTREPRCLQDAADADDEVAALGRFAGQGHRWFPDLRALFDGSAPVRELVERVRRELDSAAEKLGLGVRALDPLQLLEQDPEDDFELARPSVSCPMICLTQLATAWQAIADCGLGGLRQIHDTLSAGLCGHSQGIISAVAMASARSRADLENAIVTAVVFLWVLGVRVEAVEGGMLLLEGERVVRTIVDMNVSQFQGLHVAGQNTPNAFVLSGTPEAVREFQAQHETGRLSTLKGTKLRRLRIHSPFHSPFLADTVAKIAADAVRLELRFAPPQWMPVYCGSGYKLKASTAPSMLQLAAMVCTEDMHWPRAMASVGPFTHIVEFGPGAPLPVASRPRLAPLASPADAVVASESPSRHGAVAAGKAEGRREASTLSLVDVQSRILESLASTMGCDETDLDLQTPFFDLGLRSNDLARFAGTLVEAFDGEPIAAHELFDYPSVEQLSHRIKRFLDQGASEAAEHKVAQDAANHGPDNDDVEACIRWELAAVLMCDPDDIPPNSKFSHWGMSDEDRESFVDALSHRLGFLVEEVELHNFNSVQRLAVHLDNRIKGFRAFGQAWALVDRGGAGLCIFPDSDDDGEGEGERELDIRAIIQMQNMLRKHFASAGVQLELKRMANMCFPNGKAYLSALQLMVVDEEEKIYRSIGFRSSDMASLRQRALKLTVENFARTPQLKKHSEKLVALTWPSDTHRWDW
mmetsp:Transcript_32569/g.95317  ORF Transcript_32569/g.95317 Transcript_32569/m.95317 type:complete len:710 (-) Transcript_32569:204-2333(-)